MPITDFSAAWWWLLKWVRIFCTKTPCIDLSCVPSQCPSHDTPTPTNYQGSQCVIMAVLRTILTLTKLETVNFLHLIFWHFLIDWNCSKLLTVALIISHDLLALASSLKFCIFFSIFRNSGWSLDSSRLRLQISPHTPAARTPCCARCIFDKHFDSTTHTAQNPKKDERVITFDGGGRCWWGWWWRWWSSEMRGLPPNPWMESGARGGCCLPLPIDLHPTLPITGCTLPITASRGTGGLYCFLVHSGIFSVRHGGLDFKGVEHFFYIPIENKSIPT